MKNGHIFLMSVWLLILSTVVELLLLGVVIFFFVRLRKSEALLNQLQSKQEAFLNKLQFNAQLEQELVSTFERRQRELVELDKRMDERGKQFQALIRKAETICTSPQFLRQVVLNGLREGKSRVRLAKLTGLSLEEIELIADQENIS